jgi:hypothetical protein
MTRVRQIDKGPGGDIPEVQYPCLATLTTTVAYIGEKRADH